MVDITLVQAYSKAFIFATSGSEADTWRQHAFGLAMVMSLLSEKESSGGDATFYNEADLFK
eukprot:scaffold555150_cov31-Prasinocladus_malaysianus.AAC.1